MTARVGLMMPSRLKPTQMFGEVVAVALACLYQRLIVLLSICYIIFNSRDKRVLQVFLWRQTPSPCFPPPIPV